MNRTLIEQHIILYSQVYGDWWEGGEGEGRSWKSIDRTILL